MTSGSPVPGPYYFIWTRPDKSTLRPSDSVKAVLQGKLVQAIPDSTDAALTAALSGTRWIIRGGGMSGSGA